MAFNEFFIIDGFSFAGKGQSVFGKGSKKSPRKDGEDSGEENVEHEPDVHFEPVVPLPDLVETKTGRCTGIGSCKCHVETMAVGHNSYKAMVLIDYCV